MTTLPPEEENSDVFDATDSVHSEKQFQESDETVSTINDDEEGFESIVTPGKEFMQDPTDFSDPVETMKKNKMLKYTLFVIVSVILIAGITFLFSQYSNTPDTIENPEPIPTSSATITESVTPTETTPVENPIPFLNIYPDAPKVNPGEVIVTSNETTSTATDGNSITFTGGVLKAASTECKVIQPTDFCLTARGTTGELNYDVYYMKDAAHSRLFENPETFEETTIANSSASGILPLKMGGQSLPTLVLISENSSGWMVMLQNGDIEQLKTLMSSLTLE